MFLFLIFCAFFISRSYAQDQQSVALSIGDKVPGLTFRVLQPDGSTTSYNLSAARGKVVILDFWATWCKACVKAFPKMDSLQKRNSGNLQVVLVNSKHNRDSERSIREFMSKWSKSHKNFALFTAVEDSIASLLFPHTSIPHYVWINPAGYVAAITTGKEVTDDNVAKVLLTGKLDIVRKRDYFDNKPIFLGDENVVDLDKFDSYFVFKQGVSPHTPSFIRSRALVSSKDSKKYIDRGWAFSNQTLIDMFRYAIVRVTKEPDFNLDSRTILEVFDSSYFIPLKEAKKRKDYIEWAKDHVFIYDAVVPERDADSLYLRMLCGLNRASDYYGRIEKRKVKCYALKGIGELDKIKTKGGSPIVNRSDKILEVKNSSLERFINLLNKSQITTLPIIDQTNYSGLVDLLIPFERGNIDELAKALRKYGLELVQVEAELEMLVITEKNWRPAIKK